MLPRSILPCLVLLFASLAGLPAQETAADADAGATGVAVSTVRFRQIRAEGQKDPWLEAEVELQARPSASARALDFVKIELMLGHELSGSDRKFAYFRSSVTAVSLLPGRAFVRFYLPWEVVKRDGIPSGGPDFWSVVLSVGDRELPTTRRASSTRLGSPEVVRSFRTRVSGQGSENDGVMIPQHDSPFALVNLADVPSFVRKQNR